MLAIDLLGQGETAPLLERAQAEMNDPLYHAFNRSLTAHRVQEVLIALAAGGGYFYGQQSPTAAPHPLAAGSWQAFAWLRGLLGFAEGSANPAGMKATADWFPAKERGLAGGVYNASVEVARMLKRRFENIITYLRHRITNAASESINAKIQWVKYTARGFRNRRNFVHAIYFHCGDLDLAPEATK